MDITCQNFSETLPKVFKAIDKADFIAFDSEFSGIWLIVKFSGLTVGFEDKHSEFDTIEDRYQKLKHNCSRMNAF